MYFIYRREQMEFKILEYMIAIADAGSVTKAAEKLFISQSGLNQQLIKVEKELGTPLFYRSKKEMRLTHAGKIYIENARRILKMAQNCVTQINDLSEHPRGTISFGLPFEHGADLFIDISEAFSKKYPDVAVFMIEQTVSQMQERVRTDQLDLAFVMQNGNPSPQHFDFIHLCSEKLVLGIPKKHPLAQYAAPPGKPLRTMELERLKNDKFAFMFSGSTMRSVIDPLFTEAGFVPNIRFETVMNNVLYRLVSKGLCCTILPQSYARKDSSTAWFYLEGDPHWEWYVIFPNSRVLSSADKYLIELSQAYAKKMEDYWRANDVGSPTT